METSTLQSGTALKIVRQFSAPRERVFEALTDPALLAQWMAPTDEYVTVVDRFEAEVGGTYRIEMRHTGGNVNIAVGEIQEISVPERLVCTWRWEGGEMGDTLLTFELRPSGDATELTLLHERFPNEEAKEMHLQGWNGCLSRLERLF